MFIFDIKMKTWVKVGEEQGAKMKELYIIVKK